LVRGKNGACNIILVKKILTLNKKIKTPLGRNFFKIATDTEKDIITGCDGFTVFRTDYLCLVGLRKKGNGISRGRRRKLPHGGHSDTMQIRVKIAITPSCQHVPNINCHGPLHGIHRCPLCCFIFIVWVGTALESRLSRSLEEECQIIPEYRNKKDYA